MVATGLLRWGCVVRIQNACDMKKQKSLANRPLTPCREQNADSCTRVSMTDVEARVGLGMGYDATDKIPKQTQSPCG